MNCFTKIWFPSLRFPSLHQCENQPLKVLFEPKMMYLLNDKLRTNFFCTKSGTSHELFAWLSDVLFKYIVNKKNKKEMRENGNRWYTVIVVNEEREWSGWIFFLFPHTFTLWHKLLCTPHRLQSWSAKKAGKRPLEDKIWSKTLVCRNHKDNT